jgi:hypothetical protein
VKNIMIVNRIYFVYPIISSNCNFLCFLCFVCLYLYLLDPHECIMQIKNNIKIIYLIKDDCIKLNLYVSLIITIIICLYRCRWSLMSLITGKKVKTHTSQGIVKKQMYKANKIILRSLSFDNNGLMWPYGLIFSEYCKFFIFCYVN